MNAHFVANGIDKLPAAIATFCRQQLRLDLEDEERYEKAKQMLMPFYWRRYGGEEEKKVSATPCVLYPALTTL